MDGVWDREIILWLMSLKLMVTLRIVVMMTVMTMTTDIQNFSPMILSPVIPTMTFTPFPLW